MKYIATPLLLAASAHANAAKRAALMDEAEDALEKPDFIADVWYDGDCVDADGAVADARDAADLALAAVDGGQADLDEVVDAAADLMTAKTEAVQAVIDADAALADDLAADDAAQGTLLTLKTALDNATYDEAAKSQAMTDAEDAEAAGQLALDAEVDIQTAMNTAATQALEHYEAEQQSTIDLTAERDTAQQTHADLALEESGLQTLYDDALAISDVSAATTATKTQEKADADALNTELLANLATANAALDAATDPSVAKTLSDENDTLDTKLADVNTARDTWVALAKTTVKAMATWLTDPETYSVLGADDGCSGDLSAAQDGSASSQDGSTDKDACKAACNFYNAWSTITDGLPVGAAGSCGSAGDAVPTCCYAIDWDTNGSDECKIVLSGGVPTGNRSAGTGFNCDTRDKSAAATPLIDATAASASSEAEYIAAFTTELDEWDTQNTTVNTAQVAVDIATEYRDLLNTRSGDATTAATDANTNLVNATSTSDSEAATTQGHLDNLTAKQTEIANALAAYNTLATTVTNQEQEEADQLSIKELADGDKADQDTLVSSLQDAQTDLETDTSTATTAHADAVTALEDAQSAYDAQVDVAAATAAAVETPLSDLADLRTAAADAISALNDGNDLVGDAMTTLEDLSIAYHDLYSDYTDAVVACKVAHFDQYSRAFDAAVTTRASNLSTIGGLIDAELAAIPARGAQHSRCEKALSNGTFRPSRDETTCDEGLCCGAAVIDIGAGTNMIIETCQPEATTEWAYTPPRAPMATVAPTAQDPVAFTCIQGAQKLAAAASALAAAVYMLA